MTSKPKLCHVISLVRVTSHCLLSLLHAPSFPVRQTSPNHQHADVDPPLCFAFFMMRMALSLELWVLLQTSSSGCFFGLRESACHEKRCADVRPPWSAQLFPGVPPGP